MAGFLESNIDVDFTGKDGFDWWFGHVTTDAAWREFHKEYGYRVKVRIIGKHPPEGKDEENGVPDKDLPWAHVMTPPGMGLGKGHAGTTMCLMGGETVWGFYADKDHQVPFIVAGCYSGKNITNTEAYLASADSSAYFRPLISNPAINWSKLNDGDFNPNLTNGLPLNSSNAAESLSKQ